MHIALCDAVIYRGGVRVLSTQVAMALESRFSIGPENLGFSADLPEWIHPWALRISVETFCRDVIWKHVHSPGAYVLGIVPTDGSHSISRFVEFEIDDGKWTFLDAGAFISKPLCSVKGRAARSWLRP